MELDETALIRQLDGNNWNKIELGFRKEVNAYDMKESWKVTGSERRRNSQFAFSMVSNSL